MDQGQGGGSDKNRIYYIGQFQGFVGVQWRTLCIGQGQYWGPANSPMHGWVRGSAQPSGATETTKFDALEPVCWGDTPLLRVSGNVSTWASSCGR